MKLVLHLFFCAQDFRFEFTVLDCLAASSGQQSLVNDSVIVELYIRCTASWIALCIFARRSSSFGPSIRQAVDGIAPNVGQVHPSFAYLVHAVCMVP